MPDWLKDWWPPLALAIGLISPMLMGWIWWSLRHRFVTREDHERSIADRQTSFAEVKVAIGDMRQQTHERLAQSETRLSLVERDVKHLPTRGDFERMADRFARVETNLGRVETGVEGLSEAVNRITDHLMSGPSR
jgi:uncharacterized membrane protein YccC